MVKALLSFSVIAFAPLLICEAALSQASTSLVRIAGNVYDAADGRPLAGVVVTLESTQGAIGDQHQQTSTDGRYVFHHLQPGNYYLTAFRSGLIGEVYDMAQWSDSPLNLLSGESLNRIDFRLRKAPPIEQMPNEALAAAYPQDLPNLSAVYGLFSPDGTLFAFVTAGIAIGDPEQVWLYDMRSKRLFNVTEKPVAAISPAIRSITWIGTTLYVKGVRMQSLGDFVVKATEDGAEEIPAAPSQAINALAARTVGTAGYGGDTSSIADFRVTSTRPCHGCLFELAARSMKTRKHFAIASLPDDQFVFDPNWPVVFYTLALPWNGAIVSFNLETHISTRMDLPTHRISRLLAAKRHENGFLVAFTATSGSCTAKQSANGEDPWLLPRNTGLRSQTHQMCICFAQMKIESR